jgi:nuclear transcription Y subunit beta
MSNSPPPEKDVEQNAQSGEEQDHNDRDQGDGNGPMNDFEVKEQDRWLPIANGMCPTTPVLSYNACFVVHCNGL